MKIKGVKFKNFRSVILKRWLRIIVSISSCRALGAKEAQQRFEDKVG